MGVHSQAIQKLYVAYFNRPADPNGLAFWEKQVAASGGTAQASAAFAGSAEYKAAYAGLDQGKVVAQVYTNLFGHSPDPGGQEYWTHALAAGLVTVDNMVTAIADGAQGADLVAFNSKLAAAAAFTTALDTSHQAPAYTGDYANSIGQQFIAKVVDEASLRAATEPAALQQTIDALSAERPPPLPINLSSGVDNLLGTPRGDVFNACSFDIATGQPVTTFSPSDVIDGADGKDVLNIQIEAGRNASFGTTRNIETINILEDAATPVDAARFQGATSITQIGRAGAVTNLPGGASAGFTSAVGSQGPLTGALSVSAAGAAASVVLNGVSDMATLAVGGSALSAVSVSGSRVHPGGGGELAALALTITAGKDVQVVSVTTSQKTQLALVEQAASGVHLSGVDASASTGAIALDAAALPGIVSVRTGSGDDTIVVAKPAGQAITVQTGAGNDIVHITGTPAAGDVIDGGAGLNTLVLDGAGYAADYLAVSQIVKNFSAIKFTGAGAAGVLDLSQLGASYTAIDLPSGSVVRGVGGQYLTAHGNLTASGAADKLNVAELASGTITAYADALSLTVRADAGDVTASVAGDVHSAAVTLASYVQATTSPVTGQAARVQLVAGAASLAGLKSLVLMGRGAAEITNNDGAQLQSVEVSSLDGIDLSYRSTNHLAETIRLGGTGTDQVTLGASTYAQVDTVSGLRLELDDGGTGLAARSDRLAVAGVGTGVKVFTTSQSDLDLALKDAAASAKGDDLVFVLGGDTYIYHDTGANNLVDASDIVVRLTGTIDLKALIVALGGTPA